MAQQITQLAKAAQSQLVTRSEQTQSGERRTSNGISETIYLEIDRAFTRFEAWYGGLWTHQLKNDSIAMMKRDEYALMLKGHTKTQLHNALEILKETCKKPPTPADLKEALVIASAKDQGAGNVPSAKETSRRLQERRLLITNTNARDIGRKTLESIKKGLKNEFS